MKTEMTAMGFFTTLITMVLAIIASLPHKASPLVDLMDCLGDPYSSFFHSSCVFHVSRPGSYLPSTTISYDIFYDPYPMGDIVPPSRGERADSYGVFLSEPVLQPDADSQYPRMYCQLRCAPHSPSQVEKFISFLLRFTLLSDRDKRRSILSRFVWTPENVHAMSPLRINIHIRLIALLLKRSLYLKHDFLIMCWRVRYGCIPKLAHNSGGTPRKQGQPNAPNILREGSGHRSVKCLQGEWLSDYVVFPGTYEVDPRRHYRYVFYASHRNVEQLLDSTPGSFATQIPLSVLSTVLVREEMISIGRTHNIPQASKLTNAERRSRFEDHYCYECECHFSIFVPDLTLENKRSSARERKTRNRLRSSKSVSITSIKRVTPTYSTNADTIFPPDPPSEQAVESIVRGFCHDLDPVRFEESACSVCAQLYLAEELEELTSLNATHLQLLKADLSVCRKEREHGSTAAESIKSPLLVAGSNKVCRSCHSDLSKGKLPANSLANGLWIGEQPDVLKSLTFAEQLLVARVRHNRCLVRVSSGRAKMTANCIMYSNPIPKVYKALPPSPQELADVLAFVFLGPTRPTDSEFKRTPMLVRRKAVLRALDWLKLNHSGYQDLDISYENLNAYPEEGLPVVVDYREVQGEDGNKIPSMTSVHDNEPEEGTESGPCPFAVHGLTGEEYESMTIQALKIKALKHLEAGGSALGVGHSEDPESMYDNPDLYPQMFPWLFPYGLGGIGQPRHRKNFSEVQHRRWLLQYHDKRFQTDLYFPIVAFNHLQIKSSTTGSFLLTKRRNFGDIAKRMLNVNPAVLASMSDRLKKGEKISDATDEEKACFKLLEDLDHVGGHVQGSLTSKKYMRNEIWSLIAYKGAPSWFITFSPADVKHPLCLYLAGSDTKFRPELKSSKERNELIMKNPVAAAKFFDYTVKMFVKHILNWDEICRPHSRGLYGDTSAFYGTVEQQGRLTLHMHMMIWIENAMSPQEIRDKIMSGDSAFQRSLIDYLEGCHTGHFMTGTMSEVASRVPTQHTSNGMHSLHTGTESGEHPCYEDPTQTMPRSPPPQCTQHESIYPSCDACARLSSWRQEYKNTVDDILFRSNVHKCRASKSSKDNESNPLLEEGNSQPKGCITKDGICAARFPREAFERTVVDENDGHIFLKKLEPMMNTFTPCLTFVMRCNTDVSSLLSGTSIKAIISYVTDYITKPALKTYQVFSSAFDIFDASSELIGGDSKLKDKARKLILKIVNSLGPKMEIGSPAACMYLLGNPDHYTSHSFVPFWWRTYVNEVNSHWTVEDELGANRRCASPETEEPKEASGSNNGTPSGNRDEYNDADDKVMIALEEGQVIARSIVDDYKFRPLEYEYLNLYEWIQCNVKRRMPKKNRDSSDAAISSTSKYRMFTEEHPQTSTHYVTCDMQRLDTHIPTFIGGSPPRSDMGDREFYCMTMLAMFKPWRCPSKLKPLNILWDQAFRDHTFHRRYTSIMHNMGLKYECLDARDDFHAEMKRKSTQAGDDKHSRSKATDPKNAFDPNLYTAATDSDPIEPNGSNHSRLVSKMTEAMNIMRRVGLLGQGALSDLYRVDRFHPSKSKTAAEWKTAVKEARAAVLKEKLKHAPALQVSNGHSASMSYVDSVTVVEAEYFKHDFVAKKAEHKEVINCVVSEFKLNKEQERAFRIIANHATCIDATQLLMHLGGMGGTGKTQVIKALIRMFDLKKESHRFIVLGPTGTSAALLNGSTYHSALGVTTSSGKGEENRAVRTSATTIAELRERLSGVEYVFIDEVSMIACHELYAISSRLATIKGVDDKPFGGLNVILAGDFAQLPPTGGKSLYNGMVRSSSFARQSPRDQENLIGRLIWHQFTTVVVLKQNMRQRTQSVQDQRLRTALENMRYAACTNQDIEFLRSRIVGNGPSSPSMNGPHVRNVSIITAWNAQKDKMNDLGARRFARESGQELSHFVSADTLIEDNTFIRPHSTCPKYVHLTAPLKNALWNAPPSTSDHIPGRLSICIGMPVMIRHNDATELCITKGQEGIVRGWDSRIEGENNQVLETLFVQLLSPPKTVKVGDLPDNIVPISKSSTKIKCELPNDRSVTIQRQQVVVLPNFAMTDYASQGKTRPVNPVDLTHCKHHQSYYTCLSRSATAEGTVILQGFSESKIVKGVSGYLRQEFRDLELLNEITSLKYDGLLDNALVARLRYPLIRSFRRLHSGHVAGIEWHPQLAVDSPVNAVQHSKDDPLWNENVTYRDLFRLRTDKSKSKAERADNAKLSTRKRSSNLVDLEEQYNDRKKRREDATPPVPSIRDPIGAVWDSENHSCAYDSLITILHNLWSVDRYRDQIFGVSDVMRMLGNLFKDADGRLASLDRVRDLMREELHRSNRLKFPYGQVNTNINDVMTAVLGEDLYGSVNSRCARCGHETGELLLSVVNNILPNANTSVSAKRDIASRLSEFFDTRVRRKCRICKRNGLSVDMRKSVRWSRPPPLLFVENGSHTGCLKPNSAITLPTGGAEPTRYTIAGLIYNGNEHFVSRLVDVTGCVWYHDGISTKEFCRKEGRITSASSCEWLTNASNKRLVYTVYRKL